MPQSLVYCCLPQVGLIPRLSFSLCSLHCHAAMGCLLDPGLAASEFLPHFPGPASLHSYTHCTTSIRCLFNRTSDRSRCKSCSACRLRPGGRPKHSWWRLSWLTYATW